MSDDYFFVQRAAPPLEAVDIDLSRLSINSISAKLTHNFFGMPCIQATFNVRDVNTREMKPFYATLTLSPGDMNLAGIRKALVMLLEHELDECLYLNGVRFTDPHPEQRYYVFNKPNDVMRGNMAGKERDDTKTVNERVGREAPPATTVEDPKHTADDEPSLDDDDSDAPFSGVWSQDD